MTVSVEAELPATCCATCSLTVNGRSRMMNPAVSAHKADSMKNVFFNRFKARMVLSLDMSSNWIIPEHSTDFLQLRIGDVVVGDFGVPAVLSA